MDNVRCVVVSEDGSKCISGSSDATVKVWDIGQQRCIHSLTMHSDSVWSLASDARCETVFSAGCSRPTAFWFLIVKHVLRCGLLTISTHVGGSCLSPGVSRIDSRTSMCTRARSRERSGSRLAKGGDVAWMRCVDAANTHVDVCLCVWRRAGRDQLVYATDLGTLESSCLLRSRDAVLKMLLSPDKGLWLSMTNSDIEYWDVEPVLQVRRMHPSRLMHESRPILPAPTAAQDTSTAA